MRAFIHGVGVWGPGLPGWEAATAVLSGQAPHDLSDDRPPPPPAILSALERRRAGPSVRLALTAAQEATEMSGLAPDSLRCVFGSANGEGMIVHGILESVASTERHVSPTQFHNSVHNAAAGYWTIATGSTDAATSLGCQAFTFSACLLKAMSEVHAEARPVLLCVYDAPLPPPLYAVCPTGPGFAAALVLTPEAHGAMAELDVSYVAEPACRAAAAPRGPSLRSLAEANPAAGALRLLELLATGEAARFPAALLDGRLEIGLTPC